MSPNVLYCIGAASVLFGTVGGLFEKFAKPGGAAGRVGAVFADIGVDLTFLLKLGGGGK